MKLLHPEPPIVYAPLNGAVLLITIGPAVTVQPDEFVTITVYEPAVDVVNVAELVPTFVTPFNTY